MLSKRDRLIMAGKIFLVFWGLVVFIFGVTWLILNDYHLAAMLISTAVSSICIAFSSN